MNIAISVNGWCCNLNKDCLHVALFCQSTP